jgi:hypothetical protein
MSHNTPEHSGYRDEFEAAFPIEHLKKIRELSEQLAAAQERIDQLTDPEER